MYSAFSLVQSTSLTLFVLQRIVEKCHVLSCDYLNLAPGDLLPKRDTYTTRRDLRRELKLLTLSSFGAYRSSDEYLERKEGKIYSSIRSIPVTLVWIIAARLMDDICGRCRELVTSLRRPGHVFSGGF